MTTITISRQAGSGGNEIAQRLCEILDYRAFNKRTLAQAAAQTGFFEQDGFDFVAGVGFRPERFAKGPGGGRQGTTTIYQSPKWCDHRPRHRP